MEFSPQQIPDKMKSSDSFMHDRDEKICIFFSVAGNPKEFCFPGNIYNNNLKLTGFTETLHSPEERYPSHLSCTWLITVPDGKIVKLSFHMFSLPERTPCSPDYVEVLDGKYSYSESKGRLCGRSTRPKAIRSSGRYMTVRFRSGQMGSFIDGFRATFIAEDKPSKSEVLALICNTWTIQCLKKLPQKICQPTS